jgi:hypothetical protein
MAASDQPQLRMEGSGVMPKLSEIRADRARAETEESGGHSNESFTTEALRTQRDNCTMQLTTSRLQHFELN